ncbi:hypothetical protein HPB47_008873 [Ixodes persulcatus]|uniref:Uncharacterized protein n=1 Tax=Ixodes persulcatus TaxID=34615 RepID=A0AC60P3K9_IXOPE|nr:hypothetical protein HPB47_008873 [Ixodes persulcatus]
MFLPLLPPLRITENSWRSSDSIHDANQDGYENLPRRTSVLEYVKRFGLMHRDTAAPLRGACTLPASPCAVERTGVQPGRWLGRCVPGLRGSLAPPMQGLTRSP